MIEVHFSFMGSDDPNKTKNTISFHSVDDAIAWSNYYHNREQEFSDGFWCKTRVRSITHNNHRVVWARTNTHHPVTQEEADALPVPDSEICWG